jgi:small subunit ribosomal protein S3
VGHKTHPNGFRLITNQEHLSNWYETKSNYAQLIKKDFFIRTKITQTFQNILSVANIKIDRNITKNQTNGIVNITINVLYPRYVKMAPILTKNYNLTADFFSTTHNLRDFTSLYLKQITINLLKIFQKQDSQIYFIRFNFIKNPFENSSLISQYIAEQLEKRVPFRRILKQTIKKVEQSTNIQGLKIEIAGRLNGIEIARREWKREGKIPLHCLKAKIDYHNFSASTIYGTIGIKVWIFNGY